MKKQPGIDQSLTFYPLNIAVLTVSDTRSEETDTSGGLLVERAQAAGHVIAARALVKDDVSEIRKVMTRWIADPAIDVVLTTGGTGFSPRSS